ncbi:MAG: TrbG/VirB9 family P-type conjugative transfer protein [Candidatus Omnitrophica bacterium]|nr:TrbG/VirB9 family P-type conjugative transfer protein [Candidatus Omnitrophota bacterium]
MRKLVLIILSLVCLPLCAQESTFVSSEFVDSAKITYEMPTEDDVVDINTTVGYCTVLEFPEKPIMVTLGDSSLFRIEVPKNSKIVIVKPLAEHGESNLFVYTQTRRFNYKTIIGPLKNLDYVIDVKEAYSQADKSPKSIPVKELLKATKNYNVLSEFGAINRHTLTRKNIYRKQENTQYVLKTIEGFTHFNPHYLVVHITVQNKQPQPMKLNGKQTFLYINGKKFRPAYVCFDSDMLGGMKETDGWIVLKNTYVSLDNNFIIGVGIGGKEYVF